jgi:lysophospholipase L1-like esterase
MVALCELGADLIVVAYHWQAETRRSSNPALWQRDDYLRGRLLPAQRGVREGHTTFDVNRLGLRGPEPRSTDCRILCLGDSVTFGWTASGDPTTYPAILNRLLGTERYEVINAGLPRWNSLDLLELYVTRLQPLNSDLAILLMGWDDIGYQLAPPSPNPVVGGGRSLWEISGATASLPKVVRELHRRLELIGVASRGPRPGGGAPIHWERLEEYERILRSLAALLRSHDTEVVFVTLPHFLQQTDGPAERELLRNHALAWPDLGVQDWRRMILAVNDRIRTVAEATEALLIDCADLIPRARFVDLCHLDDRGNAILAECVQRGIQGSLNRRCGSGSDD